jgi:hypothetical protein
MIQRDKTHSQITIWQIDNDSIFTHFFKGLKLSKISNTTLNIIIIYQQHKLVTQMTQIITLTLTSLMVHESVESGEWRSVQITISFESFLFSQ